MKRGWLFCIYLTLQASGVFCITDEVMWEQFEFNFASPGARPDAMGRAFVGLADDATAAQSNPAGLVLLTRPEVSFENKSTTFASRRPAAADSLATGRTTDFGESVNSPSFASFVYPNRNLRIAVFRQEFLNYREDYRLEKRIVQETGQQLFQVDGDIRFKGVNWGVASAYRFSTRLFAGVSLRLSRLSIESVQDRDHRLGPNTEIDGSSSKFSFSVGLIANPTRKLSIGAVYERNARYEFEENYRKRNGELAPPIPLVVKVPDRYAAGVAIRPTEGLTFVADLVRVNYSQLSDDMTIIFNESSDPRDFYIKDVTEVHLGTEEVFFVRSTAVALRGGIFTNPSHRLRYRGAEIPTIATFNFGQGHEPSSVSYTLGGGVSVSNLTEIDAAYIFSDAFDELSVSFVLRF